MNYLATFAALRGKLAIPNGEPYIVVLGPYHRIHRANDGWVSRVSAMDKIFSLFNRVYVNFSIEGKILLKGARPAVYSSNPHIAQYNLDHNNPKDAEIFARLMEHAIACYAHNLHLAEHALPWIESGKVITDMHGAVPEEEALLRDPGRAEYFAAIERKLVTKSKHMVVVSSTLERHLREKYPDTRCEFIRVPICEDIRPVERHSRTDKFRRIVYCGSDHAWQNIDAMLDAVQAQNKNVNASFYSHRFQSMRKRADLRTPGHAIRFSQVKKSHLPTIYAEQDYGFILRDDTIVNRVACPTKLYEYLKCGVIPIIRTPHLGDFEDFNYQFITEHDFLHGKFPSMEETDTMRQSNFMAAQRLESAYRLGTQSLLATLSSLNQSK